METPGNARETFLHRLFCNFYVCRHLALGTCFESSTPILRKLERIALNIQSKCSEITSTTDDLSGMSNVSQDVRETCEVVCSGEVQNEVTIFFWESK